MTEGANFIIIGGGNSGIAGALERLTGTTAERAGSVDEALEMLRRKNYDIVFLDIPDKDDVLFALSCVRDVRYRYLYAPVVAVTEADCADSFAGTGISAVFGTPVDESSLEVFLKEWLPDEKLGRLGGGVPMSEELQAAASLGLNVRLALARFGGMERVFVRTIGAVCAIIDTRNEKMAYALENGDAETFTLEIHAAKSALASVGAVELADKAAEMEALAKSGALSGCAEGFPPFAKEMQELVARLRGVFPR